MIALHETWFTDARPPYDWSFTGEGLSLSFIAAAIVLALMWRAIGMHFRKPELSFL